MSDRLNRFQIDVMHSLAERGGAYRPISLLSNQRQAVVPLWRRRLIEVWYRQSVEVGPSFQGPFYALTIRGTQLAYALFNPAPRGFSGAEQS